MTVRALGWLGVRTPAADAMVAFYRDVLRLEVILQRPGATWFRLPDGTEVHVYGPDDEDHGFFGTAPVVGLAVDSFRAAHAALAAAGVEFLYAECLAAFPRAGRQRLRDHRTRRPWRRDAGGEVRRSRTEVTNARSTVPVGGPRCGDHPRGESRTHAWRSATIRAPRRR